MRRSLLTLLLVIVASALCALGYTRFIRPLVSPPDPKLALTRLSEMVDSHIDTIFSPLTADATTTIPHHELRKLRELFVDSSRNASRRERRLYASAIALCDALLEAVQAREREALSLADTRSKAYSIGLSDDRKKEAIDKARFFEFAIARRWAESAKEHRGKVVKIYSNLREQERSQDTLATSPR